MKIKIQRIFISNLIKGLIVLVFGMSVFGSFAQPTVLGTQTVNGSYVTYDLALRGAARFVRLNASSSASSGVRNWEFASGTASSTNYSINWRPYASGQTLSGYNTQIDPSSATASARYNTGWGGQSGLMPAITSGRYYTFIVGTNTAANNFMSVLETSYNPVTMTSTRNITTPNANQSVTITVTLSGPKSGSEKIFVRWSTDAFSNSNFTEITNFNLNTGTATIPAQASGTISYYIFSTEQTTPSSTNIDYYTLNLDNNSNLNYSYTVTANRWETAATGNWSSFSTWGTSSTVPNSATSNVILNSTNTLTLDQNATVNSLTINSGGTFNSNDGTNRTLTINTGTSTSASAISNSGTWTNGGATTTVAFTGNPASLATIPTSGNIPFQNLSISSTTTSTYGVTFPGTSTSVSGNLTIGKAGFISSIANSNFWGGSSSLIFDQGSGEIFSVDAIGVTWKTGLEPIPKSVVVNSGTLDIGNSRTVSTSTTTTSLTVNPGAILTVASGQSLTQSTGGIITIKSTSSGDGSIANSAGIILGNVTVERYISSAGRRWRFLSSPVQSKTIVDWRNQFAITGPGTLSNSTIGDLNSNGWHQTYNNTVNNTAATNTSVRLYVEANSTLSDLNLGWGNVSTTTPLTAGQGFRAFIRGPVADKANQLGASGNSYSQAAVTLSLTGSINSGDIAAPSLTNAFTGWNLLGNPYPCSFDWNAFYDNGTNLTNINPTAYIFDATTNAYVSYNALSNGPSSGQSALTGGIIPSGAAFFVQANGSSPSITFKESYKTTSAAYQLQKSAITDEFNIKYSKDSIESDNLFIKILDGSTLNSDIFDIKKIRNENLNLAAFGADSLNLYMSVIPSVVEETRIKLNVEATEIGTYKFEFTNLDNFDPNVSVHLFDRFTNTTTDVKANNLYNFEMGAGENQWGKNRFELILNLGKTNVDEFNQLTRTEMFVYPNPANNVLNINFNNANFKNSNIVIFNVSGKEVLKSNMAQSNTQLNIESLSSGVYFVKVSNENGFNKTVKFVK